MITIKSRHKIALARLACSFILGMRKIRGLTNRAIVRRRAIVWDLDLTEGIDFSIYLLGGFEPGTLDLYDRLVRPGDTVLDIGANIGSHTLPLARLVGINGRVISFEPTTYAIKKMQANIALNPELSRRIIVKQCMLVSDQTMDLEPEIYSSWPLFEQRDGRLHEEHGGRPMGTTGAVARTLDTMVKDLGIRKVDVIKIDVDGHENAVLSGGQETLSRCRPLIIMELAPYLFDPDSGSFEHMIQIFAGLHYSLIDANSGKVLPLDAAALRAMIPAGGTRNVQLRPNEPDGECP
jgi:FkbM family methyltransferase